MEYLKNLLIKLYLRYKPKLKRVRLEVLAWSTEGSTGTENIYYDDMLRPGSSFSLMLLPLVMKSKMHLWRPRWASIDAGKVGTIFHDAYNWTFIPKESIYPIIDNIDGDALMFAIEIGQVNPEQLIRLLQFNTAIALNYRSMMVGATKHEITRLKNLNDSTHLHEVFLAMYNHCFVDRLQETTYTQLGVYRRDGVLFILFDN